MNLLAKIELERFSSSEKHSRGRALSRGFGGRRPLILLAAIIALILVKIVGW